jgi:hypothetical protein
MLPSKAEIDQLRREHQLVHAYVAREPWLTSAVQLAMDQDPGAEHPILKTLRLGIPPSPEGDNEMPRNRNGLRPRGGGFDQEEPNGAPLPDAEQCAGIIRMMLAKHRANDQQNGGETDEHDQLMQALAQILREEHNGNGRDQMSTMPSSAPPPPARYDRRMRTASDRALATDSAVASLNRASFLRRFPGTAKVRLSSAWHD